VGGGALSNAFASLKTPFSGAMTWTQLAAVVIFVSIVLIAWRQVVNLIGEAV
jgi:hypothetical protein